MVKTLSQQNELKNLLKVQISNKKKFELIKTKKIRKNINLIPGIKTCPFLIIFHFPF